MVVVTLTSGVQLKISNFPIFDAIKLGGHLTYSMQTGKMTPAWAFSSSTSAEGPYFGLLIKSPTVT